MLVLDRRRAINAGHISYPQLSLHEQQLEKRVSGRTGRLPELLGIDAASAILLAASVSNPVVSAASP